MIAYILPIIIAYICPGIWDNNSTNSKIPSGRWHRLARRMEIVYNIAWIYRISMFFNSQYSACICTATDSEGKISNMIRMIVTDLDGTLLAGGNCIPEGNLTALRRAMDAGVQVVLCSGRMIESTLPIAQRIGVNAPMVLFNGAMLYDGAQDRILDSRMIAHADALAVLREIEAAGVYAQAFPGRGYFYETETEWTRYYAGKIGVEGAAVGMKLSQWLAGDVYKLLCLGKPAELAELAGRLAPLFPNICFVKSADTHLEIVAGGVDKATGLRALERLSGISPEEMIGFGDEANDLPMLRYVGTPYLMENAPESLRREACRIAPANTQAGLGRIINLYLDKNRMGRG